jgi:hydroxymethylglutaryl-CoA reductase
VTAKLITNNNGFFCYADPPIMITQIHITETDTEKTSKILLENKEKFISVSNNIIQNMVQRGGGVRDIYVRILQKCKLIF